MRNRGLESTRLKTAQTAAKLPGKKLNKKLNEVILLHGTKPETLMPILAQGLNERFCGGLFGAGSMAERTLKPLSPSNPFTPARALAC